MELKQFCVMEIEVQYLKYIYICQNLFKIGYKKIHIYVLTLKLDVMHAFEKTWRSFE